MKKKNKKQDNMDITNVRYEARLNRNIERTPYGVKMVYKKGTVIYTCDEKTFKTLTKKNLCQRTSLASCEGHGVYEYFDLDDIRFVKVTTVKKTTEKTVKLKDK